MSGKCIATGSCICFLAVITLVTVSFFLPINNLHDPTEGHQHYSNTEAFLAAYQVNIECGLFEHKVYDEKSELVLPSILSFTQAVTGNDQDLRFNGLALSFILATACQPLDDLNGLNTQMHKIAVVSVEHNDEWLCHFASLVMNVQNAGYSMLIYFGSDSDVSFASNNTNRLLLIPVLSTTPEFCQPQGVIRSSLEVVGDPRPSEWFLRKLHKTLVEIQIEEEWNIKMETYLCHSFFWFLVPPIITLEWMRRKKKFSCMSGAQRADEGQANVSNEIVSGSETRTMEEGNGHSAETDLNSGLSVEQTLENQQGVIDEEQPLLNAVRADVNYAGQLRGMALTAYRLKVILYKLKIALSVRGFCYLILLFAALPVDISFGGLSFFRFDNDAYIKNCNVPLVIMILVKTVVFFNVWPPFQIFCFLMYSRFACKATWNIRTNFAKLIRSDWFASNMYLLALGVGVPYCSFANNFDFSWRLFSYLVSHNTLYTVCNALFIIILDKHKFVTPYVFYISICMICAYIESDIVALFYFAQNAEGSLNNFKLTALRTLAFGFTLTISLSSSMHIIRKLAKPRESLFEGLAEK
ncbi:uncharacterized protein [Montipora foliosa]|uniref:uncharacterized protein n=1 Tax=Montipora foliosa TaxID=591990 RepID=UPI0035F1CEC8